MIDKHSKKHGKIYPIDFHPPKKIPKPRPQRQVNEAYFIASGFIILALLVVTLACFTDFDVKKVVEAKEIIPRLSPVLSGFVAQSQGCTCRGSTNVTCIASCPANCVWHPNPTYGTGTCTGEYDGWGPPPPPPNPCDKCTKEQVCINNKCVPKPKNCGNGACDAGEDCANCPEDCKCSGNQTCAVSVDGKGVCSNLCGNGRCDAGEILTCPQDCFCGNGKCEYDLGENWKTCPVDCKILCISTCTGKECGSDGCTGVCGTCTGKICSRGKCYNLNQTCPNGICDLGESIFLCPQDCKGSCGNLVCQPELGENIFSCPADCLIACTPNCAGKLCGFDGCKDSCGACQPGWKCINGDCYNNTGNITNPGYSGLLLYQKFDDYTFLGKDYSENQKHGINYDVSYSKSGKLNGDGVFNGRTSRIVVDYKFPEQGTTIAAWFKPSEINREQRVVSLEGSGSIGIGINNNGYFEFGSALSNIKASANKWYHIIGIIYPDKTLGLYVDGYRTASGSGIIQKEWSYIITGAAGKDGGKEAAGQIDEVKVYRGVLNDSEILSLYTSYGPEICDSQWKCTSWSECSNDTKTRSCTDLEACAAPTRKPLLKVPCDYKCNEKWRCDWSECQKGYVYPENCIDLNECWTDNTPPKPARCEIISLSPSQGILEKAGIWLYVILALIGILALLTAIFLAMKKRKRQREMRMKAMEEMIRRMEAMRENPRIIYIDIKKIYASLSENERKAVYPRIIEAYKKVFGENV